MTSTVFTNSVFFSKQLCLTPWMFLYSECLFHILLLFKLDYIVCVFFACFTNTILSLCHDSVPIILSFTPSFLSLICLICKYPWILHGCILTYSGLGVLHMSFFFSRKCDRCFLPITCLFLIKIYMHLWGWEKNQEIWLF